MLSLFQLILQAFLIVSALFLTGCFNKVPQIIPALDRELSPQEIQEVQRRLTADYSRLLNLKALSRTVITYRGRSERFRQAFIFERPEDLRVEFLPTTSTYTLALVVIGKAGANYLNPQEKTLEIDSSARNLLQSKLNVPADAQELMSYLAGQIPNRFLADSGELRVFKAANHDGFVWIAANGIFKAHLSEDLVLKNFELYENFDEAPIAQLTFKGYSEQNAIKIPSLILMNLIQEGVKVELNFSSTVINSRIDGKVFKFVVPDDFEITRRGEQVQ